VAAVARRLGVAPATLRTWDRRYGLGPSEHEAGAHRRYTPRDLDRLAAMRRLTLEGVPPAEAARAVLGQPLVDPPAALAGSLPGLDGRIAPSRPGGPGGRVLALPGADASVRGLGRAAMALDARAVTGALREQIAAHGVLHTWDHVLRPLLVAVGDRWAATGEGVEVEHLLAECAADVLREVASRPEELPGRRPVLLACAPDERHALPLHALAAGLGRARRRDPHPGPGHAGAGAAGGGPADRSGGAVPVVAAAGSADPQVLEDLPVTRPATAVVVGGPGWTGAVLPRRVTVADDLPHALALVDAALGG
jgi:DNA-binding transcriptional MerR regulator